MAIFGLELIPLNEPFHRKVEALFAGAFIAAISYGGYFCFLLCIYLLFTRIWWLILLYMCWIYWDKDICESGGRCYQWVRRWSWWSYMRNYFSSRMTVVPGFKLDLDKNYIFCCFPHGLFPSGSSCTIFLGGNDLDKLYPKMKFRAAGLTQLLYLPFTREFNLALGIISCSIKSLTHVLTKPEKGYGIALYVGGVAESLYSRPGSNRLVIKERKGFIKLALKTGTSLVPVFTFGETDLFDQIQTPLVCKFQQFLKQTFGIGVFIPLGRGFFQTTFGLIPRRKPVTSVVGMPIDVPKVENPTSEEINNLHERFVLDLVNLFNEYKYSYLQNPEEAVLDLI